MHILLVSCLQLNSHIHHTLIELNRAKFIWTISSLKYIGYTKIHMSLKLYIISLTVSLLVASGFGIIEYASGQANITVPQPRELQANASQINASQINASQINASQINASQILGNGSAGNMSNPCDPSYPDFCVTTYSANLTCTDIPYRNFTVLAPDTFGLDSDGDGFGCENSNVAFVNSSTTNKSIIVNTTLPR